MYGRHLLRVQVNGRSPIQQLERLVHLRIDNPFQSVSEFHAHLDSLDLLDVDRLRPQWDTYFMVRTTALPLSFIIFSPRTLISSPLARDLFTRHSSQPRTITIKQVLGGAANDSFDLSPPQKNQHLASLASRRSNCMKRRVGAILVRNNRVVGTGYVPDVTLLSL